MLKRLYQRQVHAKPAYKNADEWVIVTLNIWESFIDDWRRYGLRIAEYNFWATLFL